MNAYEIRYAEATLFPGGRRWETQRQHHGCYVEQLLPTAFAKTKF